MDVSINDLYEQASELSEDIKEQEAQDLQEFQKKAEMAYSKMKRAVKSLREAADELDQKCRDCQMAHAVGTAGGVLSGLITLGATVMTAGAASPLLLATGMGFGLGGAAINLGSSSIESAANSVKVKRAQKHLKEASDCINEVNAVIKDWLNTKEKARLVYICCLAAELKFGPFVMKLLNQVMSVCLRSISTLKVKTAGMLVTLTSAFAVEGSKAAVKSVEKVGAQVFGDVAQERIKLRERIPHIGLIDVVIPLKLFWNVLVFLRIIFPRALRGRFVEGKIAKHVGSAGVAMNAKQETIKRVCPPLMQNENSFCDL